MRLVIDNVKSEHFKWLTEMAKTLQFKVVEVELTEDEYLIAAMEEVKHEAPVSESEAEEFNALLKSSVDKIKLVKAGKPSSLEDKLTPAQKKTWKNIKQGFVEMKMAEEGKIKFRPIQELIDEL